MISGDMPECLRQTFVFESFEGIANITRVYWYTLGLVLFGRMFVRITHSYISNTPSGALQGFFYLKIRYLVFVAYIE